MEAQYFLLMASTALNLGQAVWNHVEKRNDKTGQRIADLSAQVEELEKEVAALRAETAASPNHADLAKVYDSINTLAATVNQLVGENRGQSDTLRLILNQITQKGMK